MLQGGWILKQSASGKQLNKIKPLLQEIQNDYSPRIVESLQQIMNFFLGNLDAHGILYRFGNQFSQYEPMEWASQLQKLLQHIIPDSPVFAQLVKKSKDINAQITISSAYLPHYLDLNAYERTRFINLRVTHNGISMSPLDAFYLMLAYAIYHSQTITAPNSTYQYLILDDFYSSLSRNPLLILLRKNLQYFSVRDKSIIQKIFYIMRMYLIDEVLIKYELQKSKNGFEYQSPKILNQSQDSILSYSNKKQIQLKYRLKPHHLHCLYLMLKFIPEYFSNQFSKYCQAVIEYFSSLRPDQFCLQAFIRLWIYGMTIKCQDNIENQVIKALDNSNSKQGWFYLKRYSPTSIRTNDSLSPYNTQTTLNLIKLLQKQSFWLANPSYLFTFACFFRFLNVSKIHYQEFANNRRSSTTDLKQGVIVQKILNIIVSRYNQNLVDIFSKIKKRNPKQYIQSVQLIKIYEHIIQQYITQYFKSKSTSFPISRLSPNRQESLKTQFKFKEVKDCDLTSAQQNHNLVAMDAIDKINSESKRNLVAFYRKQPKGCWEIPLQYNESIILYYIWYTVAKILDFVIPGKRQQPLLNIRFLANPINFVGATVLLIVLFLLFR